jgi:hypothetical protein
MKMIETKIDNVDAQADNSGFCNIGAEAIPISISSLLGFSSGRSFSMCRQAGWAAVPGGRFSNPPTSQSPIVVRHFLFVNYGTLFVTLHKKIML